MTWKTMHIGFDDTDSPRKGCTTYIAALLVEKLHEKGCEFVDYPNLVRLNPNVPWKTRGNGALCLRINYDSTVETEVKETVIETVEENADLEYEGTDPGIVFLKLPTVPKEIRNFAKQTITGIATKKKALSLIRRFRAEALGFKDARGIIGGLAAVGETLTGDHTYELIAYRTSQNRGTPRKLNVESVKKMDTETSAETFNNIDPGTGRVLITPRGPDPILYGIRGETPEAVKKAHQLIESLEPIERWVIFRTNHGTDAHLRLVNTLKEAKPFHPVIARGTVADAPRTIPGSHVIFTIKDETETIDCAAYKPTGNLQKIAKKLWIGDYVEVYGGIRPSTPKHPLTINLEKLRIIKLSSKVIEQNPLCPKCGKRMESMGRSKGFRCKKCKFRNSKAKKEIMKQNRDLIAGLYITEPRSQRHLTKPLVRYGREKHGFRGGLINGWHSP
jgi:tRNA(Ile2)-agmatinylcytidine synthase